MREFIISKQKTKEQLQNAIDVFTETIEKLDATIYDIEIDEFNKVAKIYYEFNV